MKKSFILTMMAVLTIGGKGFAQSLAALVETRLVATLDHNGTVTAFYGKDALVQAHTAAENGDLITLSAGTFNVTDITKAITLHGAGMYNGTNLSDISIKIPDSVTDTLKIEGIHFGNISVVGTLRNAQFNKNYIYRIYGTAENVKIIHCYISNHFQIDGSGEVHNSVICKIGYSSNATTNYVFSNCYIGFYYEYNDYYRYLKNATLINCYIETPKSSDYVSCKTLSCVVENEYSWQYQDNVTPLKEISVGELFETRQDTPPYYTIKDEYINTYVGYDSTQVSIYGGSYPFDHIPAYPQISNFDIDAHVRDGKLGVRVEVLGTKEEEE